MSTAVARTLPPTAVIPPLRAGDRMSRAEFERRYDATPDIRKAELIDGVVYLDHDQGSAKGEGMPPVSNDGHATPQFDLIGWLAIYRLATPGVAGSDNPSVRMPSVSSMPQPDCVLRVLPTHGGRTRNDTDGMLAGAPELVVEVAASSAAHDLGPKLELYQRDGVSEYVVWRTRHRVLDWFRLNRAGRYVPLIPSADGVLKSVVFPGLWLDPDALLTNNGLRILEVVQQGIASPEHAAFVAKLARVAARKKR